MSDEHEHHQRHVARGKAEHEQDTADELDRRRDVAEPWRQIAPRHGGGERRNVHQLAPAAQR